MSLYLGDDGGLSESCRAAFAAVEDTDLLVSFYKRLTHVLDTEDNNLSYEHQLQLRLMVADLSAELDKRHRAQQQETVDHKATRRERDFKSRAEKRRYDAQRTGA